MKEIKLNHGYVALVDDEDFDFLNQFKWRVRLGRKNESLYAIRWGDKDNGKKPLLRMHRVVMNLFDKNLQIDHIDHNGLNNQKGNLRVCTNAENQRNRKPNKNGTSKYKGVCFYVSKVKGKNGKIYEWSRWLSDITINRKSIRIGYFNTEESAAKAYDKAAKKHFGEFANLNFK